MTNPGVEDELAGAFIDIEVMGKAHFSGLHESAVADERLTAWLREHLTTWANSIPHHKCRDFGGRLGIRSLVSTPNHWIALRTQYETRTYTRVSAPYRNEAIGPRTIDESNIDVWTYVWPAHPDFDTCTEEYSIPESRQVVTCDTCSGNGHVQCEKCDGSGQNRCSACGGSGQQGEQRTVQRQEKCSCEGGRQGERVCYRCNGAGWRVVDKAEYYTVTCRRCVGSGRVVCSFCKGSQAVSCTTCDAAGRLVSYLQVTVSFEPQSSESEFSKSDASITSLLDKDEDSLLVHQLATVEFIDDHFAGLSADGIRSGIMSVLHSSRSRTSEERRIIKQRLSIKRADVLELRYDMNRREYTMWILGDSRRVHAPTNPFSEAIEMALERARQDIESGQIAKALDVLERCHQMEVRREVVQQTYDGLRVVLARAYGDDVEAMTCPHFQYQPL